MQMWRKWRDGANEIIMLYTEVIKIQFSDYTDILTIQTLAGVFTIKELEKGDQLGQLAITSDLPLTVARDGNTVIIGTAGAVHDEMALP